MNIKTLLSNLDKRRKNMKKLILLALGVLFAATAYAASPIRVSILGDSYSTFEGHITPATNETWYFTDSPAERTDVTAPEQTWWGILLRDSTYTLEQNNSYSGSTICNRGYRHEDYSRRSFINRMTDLGNPDLILVFGATNDFWAGVALSPEEASEEEPHPLYTFRPAIDYLLQQLHALYPSARVVFMLNDIIRGPVREAVIEACERRDVECLELSDISKRTGHPDREGMQSIADQLAAILAPSAS